MVAYQEVKSVVFGHCNHLVLKLSVNVKEQQDMLPTMYWSPKLHNKQYKAMFKLLYHYKTF